MKKIITMAGIGLLLSGSLSAQVYIMEENFTPTGVSNEGLVVGYHFLAGPYSLWDPRTEEVKEIGGISAGDNHGGMARFSEDCKWICASSVTKMDWPEGWTKYPQYQVDYTINSIAIADGLTFYAIGKKQNGNGVVLTSSDGMRWREIAREDMPDMPDTQGSLNAISFATDYVGFMGGDDAYFAYTTTKGTSWYAMDPRPAGSTDKVESYPTLDFIQSPPYAGVVGAELENGGYAVYQTPDGGESWQATTGVAGIPVHISHIGNIFYLVTKNGHIQRSIDNGLHWTDVFTTDKPLYKIRFSEDKVGIALSQGGVFRTMDGGKSWNEIPSVENTTWNDLLWQDALHGIMVGSDGACYSTDSRGATWQKVEIDEEGKNLTALAQTDDYLFVGGVDGNFYRYIVNMPDVSMMSRYNVANDTWEALGNLGYISYPSASSAYYMSGDGKTVVGIGQIVKYGLRVPHAMAWSETEGVIDLGGKFDNLGRATRANCVSRDGSVIVGWQDENGPWHSAVWRKNPEGGYFPNEFILKDPSKGSSDITNRLGQCFSVSPNGKWIGGRGQEGVTATAGAWIWSEETGVKEISTYDASVTGINNDGTLAVGYDAGLNGFIWSEEDGFQTVDDYARNKFGYDGDTYLCSIMNMSYNGRYLCGWGVMGDYVHAYMIDRGESVSIENMPAVQCNASVYPNPVSEELHVDLFYNTDTQISLLDLQGRIVLSRQTTSQQNKISLAGVNPGLYLVDVRAGAAHKTFKIEVIR